MSIQTGNAGLIQDAATSTSSDHPPGEGVVTQIIRAFKNLKRGAHLEGSWSEYKLSPSEYDDLIQRLQNDRNMSLWGFVIHKTQHHYFPSTNRFIIQDPTPRQAAFTKSINDEIQNQLKVISENGGAHATFAKEILFNGSDIIDFDNSKYGSHSPDGQFRHKMSLYPGVVLEVADALKAKDLPVLAAEYILGSKGGTRVVVGLNFSDQEVSLSVWEADTVWGDEGNGELVVVQVVREQKLRDEKCGLNEAAGLDLRLHHFSPMQDTLGEGKLPEGVLITTDKLLEFLDAAEKVANAKKETSGLKRPPESNTSQKPEEPNEKRVREGEEETEWTTESDDSG